MIVVDEDYSCIRDDFIRGRYFSKAVHEYDTNTRMMVVDEELFVYS